MIMPMPSHSPRSLEPVHPSAQALQRRGLLLPVTRSTQVLRPGRTPAQLPLFPHSGAIDLR